MNASNRAAPKSTILAISRRHFLSHLGSASLLCLSSCATPPSQAHTREGLSVIVHPDNNLTAISIADLNKIFSRRMDQWKGGGKINGTKIRALDLPPEDPMRMVFSRRVFDKSTAEVQKWWIDTGFNGGKRPPPVRSAREVLELVSHKSSAIGYVPSAMVKGRAKVLLNF